MMDLDEAIKSFESEMEKQTALGHSEHVENLEQMSEWLKELKAYKEEPIGYQNCADAMMKTWIDNVLTDGEYNRIMDKLNEHWR